MKDKSLKHLYVSYTVNRVVSHEEVIVKDTEAMRIIRETTEYLLEENPFCIVLHTRREATQEEIQRLI